MNNLKMGFLYFCIALFLLFGIVIVIILAASRVLERFCGGKKQEGFCGCGATSVGGSTGVPVK